MYTEKEEFLLWAAPYGVNRVGNAVARSRAFDALNVKFGFHNCPPWMPVFVHSHATAFGMAIK